MHELRISDPMWQHHVKAYCIFNRADDTGSTCEGEAGGPFMVENTNKTYYSFGMVSFGLSVAPCGESVSYTVFAYLGPNIMDWINEQMLN